MASYVETVKETKRLKAALPKTDRYRPYYWPVEVSYAYYEGYEMSKKWRNTTRCVNSFSNFTYVNKPKV